MRVWPTPKPAVLAAVTLLQNAFGSYAVVSASLPKGRPERFVRVTRVGGGQQNPAIDNARILVECFAIDTSMVEAMCNTVRAALRNAAGTTVTCVNGSDTIEVFIRGWDDEQGPVDFPHPEILDRQRWQLHGDLVVKSN